MPDKITLKAKNAVTYDTNHYVFSRPEGMTFEPGQAAEIAIQKEGWKDEGRPFTFTSMPSDDDLEFVIKSYPDHNGVTEQLATLEPGAELTIDGPFGAIQDQGAGVFLAAGAGITPFIPILKKRALDGTLEGCTLIFSNKTEKDIIMRGQWEAMEGLKMILAVTDEKSDDLHSGMIDKSFLETEISDFDQMFYLCGPGGFVDAMRDTLKDLGAKEGSIVTEDGW
jgi:ferredoxin-NADP reductase